MLKKKKRILINKAFFLGKKKAKIKWQNKKNYPKGNYIIFLAKYENKEKLNSDQN